MTPEQCRKELYAFIDALPLVKPSELKVGETFIMAGAGYTRVFGSTNFAMWEVRQVMNKFLRYQVFGDNGKSSPHQMFLESGIDILRRATSKDVAHALSLNDDVTKAERKQCEFDKRCHDRYILWNEIFGDDYEETSSEGFVLEVFDGNGRRLHHIRFLSDDSIKGGDGEEIKRMAEAYARGFHAEDRLTIEQQIVEMD